MICGTYPVLPILRDGDWRSELVHISSVKPLFLLPHADQNIGGSHVRSLEYDDWESLEETVPSSTTASLSRELEAITPAFAHKLQVLHISESPDLEQHLQGGCLFIEWMSEWMAKVIQSITIAKYWA